MNDIPQKNSLVSQVVAILESKITQGDWQEWLPNERSLCASLYISRNTLRAALAQLKARKIVRAIKPFGTKILVSAPKPRPSPTRTIGLLSPIPAGAMRPNVALIIDSLRGHLAEAGYRLHLHHGEHLFHKNSHSALRKLTENSPHDCWVLVLANSHVKRWFVDAGPPCVVSGSCSAAESLPFVDINYRALCRHAAGQMLAAGHRRIVFFTEKSARGGDIDSESGFMEGFENTNSFEVEARVVRHQGTPVNATRMLEVLFNSRKPPTAMLVANPHYYLLALTFLQQRGLRVPSDVSLMCRDDDPFLQFVQPPPACYGFDPQTFAKRLFKLIMRIVNHQTGVTKGLQIMPDYRKGMTLGKRHAVGTVG